MGIFTPQIRSNSPFFDFTLFFNAKSNQLTQIAKFKENKKTRADPHPQAQNFSIFPIVYKVALKKKAEKMAKKMPEKEQAMLKILVDDLKEFGPIQAKWSNYSKLSDTKHHCHLSYRWVACWEETKKGLTIEVYYAGSRESAPY